VLDASLRRLIERPLAATARPLARAQVSANAVTLAGFILGLAAAVALAFALYWLGLALLLLNRLADGLDGAVARIQGPSDRGGYLDIVCDFLVYNALAVGFALADPAALVPALFLMLSFVGTGTSFLAYAILAAKRGVAQPAERRSFYYLGGLTEGGETILFFVACCLWPAQFPLFAWIFAGLCAVTTLGRMAAAWRDFG